MTHLLRHGVWVAICDGGKALVLENQGDHDFPNLHLRMLSEHAQPPARELGSDAPGRAFASSGARRSAYDQNDLHEQSERDFLASFAQSLAAALKEADTPALILVAPARAMGLLRPLLPASVRQKVTAELVRDYVHLPLSEIEEQLRGLQRPVA